MMKRMVVLLMVGVFLLSACSFNGSKPIPSATASPSFTPSPSITPSPTATSTATLIPTATSFPHPLSVERMRADTYPGSEIVIEEELTPGNNYSRYYVSYQSEGLTIYGLLTVPNGAEIAERNNFTQIVGIQ